MSVILKKYYGIFLLAIMPLLLISNAKFDSNSLAVSKDTLIYDSFCATDFKRGTETIFDGTKFSFLELHIEDESENPKHSVEFTISRGRELGKIGPGKYRIVKDEDGFLNFRNGIFGFLNSKDQGELPFFAHFGEITIAKLDEKAIKGSMNIYFKNSVGDSVQVKGDFIGEL